MATVQIMACKVTQCFVMISLSFLLFLCLQESAQAKSIQHHLASPRFVTRMEAVGESSGRPDKKEAGHYKVGSLTNSYRSDDPLGDNDESDDDDDDTPWYDYQDVDNGVDGGCDDRSDISKNPWCHPYDMSTDYYDLLRNAADMRRPVEKRRLRFHKRRQYFAAGRRPGHASTSPGTEMDGVYLRDSRAPRLRFVKRDLNQKDTNTKQPQAAAASAVAPAAGKSHANGHSRKRRSISDLGRGASTDKRRLSINGDIYALADMVFADMQRQFDKENEDLRRRLLAVGKKRSEPKVKISDLSDAAISRAFVDVIKSLTNA